MAESGQPPARQRPNPLQKHTDSRSRAFGLASSAAFAMVSTNPCVAMSQKLLDGRVVQTCRLAHHERVQAEHREVQQGCGDLQDCHDPGPGLKEICVFNVCLAGPKDATQIGIQA